MKESYIHPYDDFILAPGSSPEVANLQEKIILYMVCPGWTLFAAKQFFSSPSIFSKLAAINIKWLTMLIPFEHEPEEYNSACAPG